MALWTSEPTHFRDLSLRYGRPANLLDPAPNTDNLPATTLQPPNPPPANSSANTTAVLPHAAESLSKTGLQSSMGTLPLTPPRSPPTPAPAPKSGTSRPSQSERIRGPLPHDGVPGRLTSNQWAFLLRGVTLGGPVWDGSFESSDYFPKCVS